MDEEVNKFPVWKFLFILMNLVLSLVLSITGYLAIKVLDVNDRLITIESSRCTSEVCASINNTITDIKGKLEWHRDKISSNSSQCATNATRLSILERDTLKRAK